MVAQPVQAGSGWPEFAKRKHSVFRSRQPLVSASAIGSGNTLAEHSYGDQTT